MANSNSAAVLRQDITTVLTEGNAVDQMFIGLDVFPVYGSDAKDGQFPKFKLATGELLNNDATLRQPTGSYGRVYRTYENDNFSCLDRGLEELVDDTYKSDVSRFFQAELMAANQVYRQVRLGHEIRVAQALMNSSNFTATAAAVAYTENLIATIDLVKDVTGACSRLNDKGIIPNTIVMSKNVFQRVRRSTLLTGYLRGSKSTDSKVLASADDIASVFAAEGIQKCLVGKMPYNSGKKGAAYSASQVWGDTYIWVGQVAGGDFMAGGAGRTIVWNPEGGVLVSETYRSEERRSDVVRVRQNTAEKVVDGTAGELITTSYA